MRANCDTCKRLYRELSLATVAHREAAKKFATAASTGDQSELECMVPLFESRLRARLDARNDLRRHEKLCAQTEVAMSATDQ
jgi:hypothetical protein